MSRVQISDALVDEFEHQGAVCLRGLFAQSWLEKLAYGVDKNFADPAEPQPVTRAMLEAYMHRWNKNIRAHGTEDQWKLTHELRQDKDGVLTDWEWWEVLESGLCGAAIVQTGDKGVLFERITYFDRNIRHPQT